MKTRARNAYLLLEGVSSFLFHLIVTIYVIYYSAYVGLDPLQIVLVGTIFEATIFLFEIPTGIVADLYSRRLSVIVGIMLAGIGFLIEGFFPVFGAIVFAEILGGIGATFISGAAEAWIADEVGEAEVGQVFIRAAQLKTLCGMLGIIASIALGSIQLNLPMIFAGGSFIALAAFLTVYMPETGFQRNPERTTWQSMLETVQQGTHLLRARPALMLILAVGFVFAFHTEGFDHLWQRQLLENFQLPLVWFGVIGIGANLLGIMINEIVRRWMATPRTLTVIYAVITVGILVFSFTTHLWLAVVAYWTIIACRNVSEPLYKAWFNQGLEPSIRATMFSLNGQIGSVGEIVGGLPVGMIGRVVSVRWALAASGMILTLALPLLKMAQRQEAVTE